VFVIHKVRQLLLFNKALDQYTELSKEIELNDMKSLFVSKTFWLNITGIALSIGGVLPPKFGLPVLAVANVAMRPFDQSAGVCARPLPYKITLSKAAIGHL